MIAFNVDSWKRGDTRHTTLQIIGTDHELVQLIDQLSLAGLGPVGDTSPAAMMRDALIDGTPLVAKTWPPPTHDPLYQLIEQAERTSPNE